MYDEYHPFIQIIENVPLSEAELDQLLKDDPSFEMYQAAAKKGLFSDSCLVRFAKSSTGYPGKPKFKYHRSESSGVPLLTYLKTRDPKELFRILKILKKNWKNMFRSSRYVIMLFPFQDMAADKAIAAGKELCRLCPDDSNFIWRIILRKATLAHHQIVAIAKLLTWKGPLHYAISLLDLSRVKRKDCMLLQAKEDIATKDKCRLLVAAKASLTEIIAQLLKGYTMSYVHEAIEELRMIFDMYGEDAESFLRIARRLTRYGKQYWCMDETWDTFEERFKENASDLHKAKILTDDYLVLILKANSYGSRGFTRLLTKRWAIDLLPRKRLEELIEWSLLPKDRHPALAAAIIASGRISKKKTLRTAQTIVTDWGWSGLIRSGLFGADELMDILDKNLVHERDKDHYGHFRVYHEIVEVMDLSVFSREQLFYLAKRAWHDQISKIIFELKSRDKLAIK